MNNLYNKWLKGGLLGLAVVAGLSSCTDDHFDVKGGIPGAEGTNSASTLWQNISTVDNLSDFASILAKTKVTKSNIITKSGLTYKDLLDTDQAFTVWAPVNGSEGFDAQYWLNLLASGDTLTVEKRLVRNHISRFNYRNSFPAENRVTLLNAKVNTFDVRNTNDMSFKRVDVLGESVVPSSNGTLYMLNGMANYATNVYEYLDENSDLSDMAAYVQTQDTAIFSEMASTPGATVDGKVQYVDSVWIEYNKMLGASIASEDSSFVCVYPTNKAWKEAKQLVGSFFKLPAKKTYYDESNKLVSVPMNADSLSDIMTYSTIFRAMYFSLNDQPNLGFRPKDATVEKVKNFVENADSLKLYGTLSTFIKNPKNIFDNQTPVELSNGYAFVVDNYRYVPNETWQDSISQSYSFTTAYLDQTFTKGVPYDATAKKFMVDLRSVLEENKNPYVTGKLSDNAYAVYKPEPATGNPTVAFKLPLVLSGTYDIYVTVVPMNITDTLVETKPTRFTATLSYFDADGKRLTRYCKNANNLSDITEVTTASDKITTLCSYMTSDSKQICRVKLFENFKFPYTTLPISTKEVSTVLTIATNLSTRDERNKFSNTFNLDCITLIPKDGANNE